MLLFRIFMKMPYFTIAIFCLFITVGTVFANPCQQGLKMGQKVYANASSAKAAVLAGNKTATDAALKNFQSAVTSRNSMNSTDTLAGQAGSDLSSVNGITTKAVSVLTDISNQIAKTPPEQGGPCAAERKKIQQMIGALQREGTSAVAGKGMGDAIGKIAQAGAGALGSLLPALMNKKNDSAAANPYPNSSFMQSAEDPSLSTSTVGLAKNGKSIFDDPKSSLGVTSESNLEAATDNSPFTAIAGSEFIDDASAFDNPYDEPDTSAAGGDRGGAQTSGSVSSSSFGGVGAGLGLGSQDDSSGSSRSPAGELVDVGNGENDSWSAGGSKNVSLLTTAGDVEDAEIPDLFGENDESDVDQNGAGEINFGDEESLGKLSSVTSKSLLNGVHAQDGSSVFVLVKHRLRTAQARGDL